MSHDISQIHLENTEALRKRIEELKQSDRNYFLTAEFRALREAVRIAEIHTEDYERSIKMGAKY